MSVSMRNISEALSRMDNAVAVYSRRFGATPSVKIKVERLETSILENRTVEALDEITSYAKDLHSRKRK